MAWNANRRVCENCPAGTHYLTDEQRCGQCPANLPLWNGRYCVKCPPNTEFDPDENQCYHCPEGFKRDYKSHSCVPSL